MTATDMSKRSGPPRHPAVETLGVSIFRTEFGDEIVASYRRQLEDGQRIRWGNA
jgi:hypothetical protein